MITVFGKKKLTENKLANIFVNSLINLVDEGFPEVAGLINEDPEFVTSPNISADDSDPFLLIVLAGNLAYVPAFFESIQDRRLIDHILYKFSLVFEMKVKEVENLVKEHHSFFKRINHPSKNTLYAMSKAIFYKYNLNEYQVEYFRNLNTPNPIFIKHLDEIVVPFLWDWNEFLDKYKIVQ